MKILAGPKHRKMNYPEEVWTIRLVLSGMFYFIIGVTYILITK